MVYIISKSQSNYVYNLEKYTTFFKKKMFLVYTKYKVESQVYNKMLIWQNKQ